MLADDPFDAVTVILVSPSHPGNIGAAARAMKTMGLRHLSLVTPKQFPHADATALASGAVDILAVAKVFPDLKSALAPHTFIAGVSARLRDVEKTVLTPRDFTQHWQSQARHLPTALVFGNEQSGLSNEELGLCHVQITIPTAKDYGSLNLAQAVQVICYELRLCEFDKLEKKDEHIPANQDIFEGMFNHWCEVLEAVKYLHPKQRDKMLFRMRNLMLRAQCSEMEITILRGAFRDILRQVKP